MEVKMKEQAVEILEKALNLANLKGSVFTLQDANIINQALHVVKVELGIPLVAPQGEGPGPQTEQEVPKNYEDGKKAVKPENGPS